MPLTHTPSAGPFRTALLALVVLLASGAAGRAAAQAPLFLVNDSTTVRKISFKFADSRTFEESELQVFIATAEPTFMDRVRRILPFTAARTYPFDAIALQKDVVRLREYYYQNGFLSPAITYGASQLDTTSNTIHVLFSIEEGPPLIIQDVGFFGPDGDYLVNTFRGEMRERWIDFYDRTTFKTGDRYTNFDLLRIQDQVLLWLRDRGYAFATLDAATAVDSSLHTIDIRFAVDPGPRGRFAAIEIEGEETVGEEVVRRELPFKEGDRFSYSKLIEGQRELFELNLFRVALADVPPAEHGAHNDTLVVLSPADTLEHQPRDSTVTVRYRVREAKLRYLSAQTGYAPETGTRITSTWTHRNFFGGARTLSVSATANTGFPSTRTEKGTTPRLFRLETALTQPYLFTRRLSGTVAPYIQYELDPLLQGTDPSGEFLNLNRREIGTTTTLYYELLPFRIVSLSYSLSGVSHFERDGRGTRDVYGRSVISLGGTFGRVDDFLRPRSGFLLRPFLEEAGGVLRSGVEYLKGGTEAVGYLPLGDRIGLAGRLYTGSVRPFGQSRQALLGEGSEADSLRFEDRFDAIVFYAGGPNDVRGWPLNRLGPLVARADFVVDSTGQVLYANGLPRTKDEKFEEVGGLAKLTGNIELRLPFPFLGPAWRSAIFLDFGQVSSAFRDPATGDFDVVDRGRLRLRPGAFHYGTGVGLRYETAIGFIRLDLGYMLNPDPFDLLNPRQAFLLQEGYIDHAQGRFRRRLRLHLSIGQAF